MILGKHKRRIAWGGIALTMLLTWLSWNTNAAHMGTVLTHASDPLGYYQYLPSYFMEGDLSSMKYVHYLPNGKGLCLFTMGVALLLSPFFLLAWAFCGLLGIPATGFELPFVFARLLAASTYMAGGMVLLYGLLLRWYSPRASMITVGGLLFGTTLYFYTVHNGGMSHVYSFFLIIWAVHLTYAMLEATSWHRLLGLVVCSSLIILIRPLNGVALLFVLLAGSPPKEALRVRMAWLSEHPTTALLGGLLGVALWLPQFMYWKAQTGSWVVFTYGRKDESFDFADPHLIETLLSFQNGWFIYTPLMLVVFGMLLWQAWNGTKDSRVILTIWVVVWYVYSSWWCWWLGSAFGYRGFLELYALLAFPFAALLDRVLKNRIHGSVALVFLLLLVWLNVRLGHIYQHPWEAPEWNWSRLGEAYLKALTF